MDGDSTSQQSLSRQVDVVSGGGGGGDAAWLLAHPQQGESSLYLHSKLRPGASLSPRSDEEVERSCSRHCC